MLVGVVLLGDAEDKMIKKDVRVMRYFEEYNIHEDVRQRGVVIAEPRVDVVTGEEKVYVKWDETRWRQDNPEELLTSSLVLEADGDEEYNKLEAEWNIAEAEVAAKLKQAADLITEAGDIAGKAGCDSLSNMYDAIRPLYRAMDNAGWNTSSFGC
jgi:hypothetical protein